jgi:hypothetical protein
MRRRVKRMRRFANSGRQGHAATGAMESGEPLGSRRRRKGASMPAPSRLSLSVAPGNARELELWRWDHAPLNAMGAQHALFER